MGRIRYTVTTTTKCCPHCGEIIDQKSSGEFTPLYGIIFFFTFYILIPYWIIKYLALKIPEIPAVGEKMMACPHCSLPIRTNNKSVKELNSEELLNYNFRIWFWVCYGLGGLFGCSLFFTLVSEVSLISFGGLLSLLSLLGALVIIFIYRYKLAACGQANQKTGKAETPSSNKNNSTLKNNTNGLDDDKYSRGISINYPNAVSVTSIYDLEKYLGRFVKIEITNLENWDTFSVRDSSLSRRLSEDERVAILSKPLKELQFDTLRGTIRLGIEPISTIVAGEYEKSHYIYGILRQKERYKTILTNAFINPLNENFLIIQKELERKHIFEYSILEDGSLSIFNFFSASNEELDIPEKIENKVVTRVSHGAFSENNDILSVKVSNTIKSIESEAFYKCNRLESVVLGSSVNTLNWAFNSCESLRRVYIGKSVAKLNNSFHNCQSLTEFEIDMNNESLTVVEGVLFSKDCSILVQCPCGKKGRYVIPYGTVEIGEGAFEGSELNEIILPSTIKKIDSEAFSYLDNIKKLVIPPSVIDIEYDALSGADYEIVVEKNSYAHTFFANHFDADSYTLSILDKIIIPDHNYEERLAEESIFCRHCGIKIPADSVFCYKCGIQIKK